eukprot:81846-Pelagomonas_calceolata.AAC.2
MVIVLQGSCMSDAVLIHFDERGHSQNCVGGVAPASLCFQATRLPPWDLPDLHRQTHMVELVSLCADHRLCGRGIKWQWWQAILLQKESEQRWWCICTCWLLINSCFECKTALCALTHIAIIATSAPTAETAAQKSV